MNKEPKESKRTKQNSICSSKIFTFEIEFLDLPLKKKIQGIVKGIVKAII